MISALVLSLALAGTRADSAAAATATATVASEDPAVQLWISNDRRFVPGDRATVEVRTRDDAYLLVLHVDTDGNLRVLFPLDPKDVDFVRGGRKYEARGRGGRESFTIDSRTGQGTVYAAASPDPFKFDDFVVGDHWDYHALAPQRLSAQPESDLNDLVRRMSQVDFDYDILTYDVFDRVAYSDSYSSTYYGSPYYSGYYGSCFGCGYWHSPGLSVGLSFGWPYSRAYYDPFFYDPYYYPAYYPGAYYPYYGYSYYSYPYYNYPYTRYGGYYNNAPGHRFSGPYTPYRFRGNDAVAAGYRGRGFSGGRSVNTVYLPPRSRVIQPGTVNPARRLAALPVAAPAARRNGGRVESGGRANANPSSRQESWPQDVSRRPNEPPRDVTARRAGAPGGRTNASPSSRQEKWPRDVSPRRTEPPRDATARRADITLSDATPRGPAPRDVTPRRAVVDRPQIERAPVVARGDPRVESRSSRSEQQSPSAAPSGDRSGGSWSGGDRGGGGRSAPAAPSWGGGGSRGGGGGQAPSGGGGRRR